MPAKKFLLLSSHTIPDTSGSGINAYNFAQALKNNLHNVKVLSFRRSLKTKKDSLIIRIPYFSKTIFGKLISLPVIFISYLLIIPGYNVLVIYGSRIIAWEFAVITAKLFRTKIIFQSLLPGVDNLNAMLGKSPFHSRVYRSIFSMIDAYHSINNQFSEEWKRWKFNKKKLLSCPQGVNHIQFSPLESNNQKLSLRRKLGIPEEAFLIMTSGFLIERKGLKTLFRALSTMETDFLLLHIGESQFGNNHFLKKYANEANKLKELAQNLLDEKVIFKGFTPLSQKYFKCADIYAHGNATEGLPNVFLEAMSTGIPILTYPINGLNNTLLKHGENCLFFTNEQEFTHGIKELQENQELRSSIVANANEFIKKEASFEVIIKKMLTFLYH